MTRLLRVAANHAVVELQRAQPASTWQRAETAERLNNEIKAPSACLRLNVFPIQTPPLRHRADDIPVADQHFLRAHARANHRSITTIASRARCLLAQTLVAPCDSAARRVICPCPRFGMSVAR